MKQIICLLTLIILMAGCAPKEKKSNNETSRNKATMQRFYDDVFNKHNTAKIDSLVAPDYLEHNVDPGYANNREGMKKLLNDFFVSYPDIYGKINFMLADSDMVMVHFTMRGTNSGPSGGMPATNKMINLDGVDIMRFNKDGLGCEHWGYMEELKMMDQLGMLPPNNPMPDTVKPKKVQKKKPKINVQFQEKK